MQKIVRYICLFLVVMISIACQSRLERTQRKAEQLTSQLVSALDRKAPMDTIRAIAEQDKNIVFYIFDSRQAVYWSSNRLAADAIYLYAYDTWRDMIFANAKGLVRWTKAGIYNILTILPTGYTELDEMLTGLHPGELVLVAGRPAMGKTSIGMNFVENAAIRAGKKAAVFSLEMPAEQLAMRMMCTEARVDMQKVRRGAIDDEEWGKLADALVSIGPSSIYIDCTPGITVPEVRSKARRLQLEHGLDLIMIDYLSLMTATGKTGSRQEEVSQISRTLKGLAMELGVPVIALQQLSRAPTGRANHRPLLSDIRESGAIEQDADVVMFIHREDYYDPDTPDKNIAELIIAKQRNGSLGTVKLGWKGEYTWFMDLSPRPKEAV